MNRTMPLANAGKIILCQSYYMTGKGSWGANARFFSVANYFLMKGNYTYLSFGSGVWWFPSFAIPLGAPTETYDAPAGYWRPQWGVFARTFSNGLVLLNPGNHASPTITLPRGIMHNVSEHGGGAVAHGAVPAGGLSSTPMASLVVPGHAGRILLDAPI